MERSDGGQRKLHCEDLHGFYYASVIRIISSGRKRKAGHVARMRKEWNTYRTVVGKGPFGRRGRSFHASRPTVCVCTQ